MKLHERKAYVQRSVTAALDHLLSMSQSQLTFLVAGQLKRAQTYIGFDYPSGEMPVAAQFDTETRSRFAEAIENEEHFASGARELLEELVSKLPQPTNARGLFERADALLKAFPKRTGEDQGT